MRRLVNKEHSIKRKMLSIVLVILIPVAIIVAVVFWQTNITLKKKAIESLNYSAKEISSQIDKTIVNIYNVSDTFANETRLNQYLDEYYGEKRRIEKQHLISISIRRLFDGYNLLQKHVEISAIHTDKNELFNIIDVNQDGPEVIEKLKELDIHSPKKLARFYWYPLQENFLKSDPYQEVRKDKVIIGSRRIYSKMKGTYPYVHLFVLREEAIYEKYENIAKQMEGDVYILNENGELLSASVLETVESGQMPEEIAEAIALNGKDSFELIIGNKKYFISTYRSVLNDWLTVISVPSDSITGTMQQLYVKLFWVISAGIILCIFLIIYLYRSFMNPISQINQAMKKVYLGDLNAYVDEKGSAETRSMMHYYNSMLESINVNVKEKFEMQKNKKELELEVLMSQVNPHFLYNTLETIVWKASEVNSPEIGRIAAALGRFYRLSISSGRIMVSVSQEIEHVSHYIHIQKSRYGDQFQFDLRADFGELRSYYTLKLVLQPVVENSFMHAMRGLQRQLTIRLSIYIKDTCLKIVVIDNGAGMSRERLWQTREQIRYGKKQVSENSHREKKSSGIGLYGVNARLNLYFGIQKGVKIYSMEGKGTMVVIRIPKLESDTLEE